ncbi:Cell division protein FtsI [Peptidoglycan synthetase] [hydrothermal vent metagenome]|uniref:Cell division protein FtsI [Peptidoglycan synthetase] n=1 Tax=hydrothermal vent metagenome TaxID=652676 RepID=A0A3B1AR27_9ZZZZ
MSEQDQSLSYRGRRLLVLGVLALAAAGLAVRAVNLQVLDKDFLQGQGDARFLRVVSEPAHRGMITDRFGEPLAISTPVDSVWANPKVLILERDSWTKLARALRIKRADLERLLVARQHKEFVYLKRRVNPDMAQRVSELEIPGVAMAPEYRRFYPAGEVTAHVVGFTDVDDAGQEGVELAFDERLRSIPGAKRVIKDRLGRIVESVERVREPQPGEDIALSIDLRLQYLAYRELKAAVRRNRADAGSAVILDVHTGEVLAMVNQPAYNPNNRSKLKRSHLRNRAVTDVFEPGSTIKPFTVAAALETGRFHSQTPVDTTPGYFRVGRKTIHDFRDYGLIDVSTVIQKSSNVGASKLALAQSPEHLWKAFASVGLGESTGSGFPGESGGLLTDYGSWRDIQRATISYGYGMSTTTLQLARAYAALATDGRPLPVSFLRRSRSEANELATLYEPAFSADSLHAVRGMMERVVAEGGTGTRAAVSGYRIAGKTGTVKKSGAGGYVEDSFIAVFAGIAPASEPRLVMVVMIDEPRGEKYYGGVVAAPVFGKVMAGALRLLDIPPDDLPSMPGQRLALLRGDGGAH